MIEIRPLSSLQKDYLVRSLRLELENLKRLVESLENSGQYESGYVDGSIKSTEIRLRSLSHFLRDI